MTGKKNHVHFIGICGVAMAPVAKIFLDLDWQVSGSDAGFFPPVSDYLKKYPAIKFYPGFHPNKVGQPNLVVIGNFIGSHNPEFKYIKEQGIEYKSYPEILARYVIKKNSIVVVGTYGKTTITALLAWILKEADYKPSFMVGGILRNFPDSVRATDSNWSVVEGDEYPADRRHNKSKFFYYQPKYLILTSAAWDHMDVFKTETDYIDNFKKLVSLMSEDGLIVANKNGVNVEKVLKDASCRVVYYKDPVKDIKTSLIGDFILENINAAVTLAQELNIEDDIIKKAVKSFQGVKRRLEERGKTVTEALVFDDIAHSPVKARATLRDLKNHFNTSQIFAIFEPNVGSRTQESLPSYEGAFNEAYEVIIPKLSIVKIKAGEQRLNGQELAEHINKTHARVSYIEEDDKLIEYLKHKPEPDDVIVFLGSRGFRGMIEELIK